MQRIKYVSNGIQFLIHALELSVRATALLN